MFARVHVTTNTFPPNPNGDSRFKLFVLVFNVDFTLDDLIGQNRYLLLKLDVRVLNSDAENI